MGILKKLLDSEYKELKRFPPGATAGGIGLHRAELAAAGGGAGASGPPCGPALRGQPVLL